MTDQFKPGEIAKLQESMKWREKGGDTCEVTCMEGEHFPPISSGKGAHYVLTHAATHVHRHGELKGRDAS